LVPAEVTHNGVCAVGHYVHCGWGHQCSTSDLIDGAAADRIQDLEARLEAMTLQHEAALEAVERAREAALREAAEVVAKCTPNNTSSLIVGISYHAAILALINKGKQT